MYLKVADNGAVVSFYTDVEPGTIEVDDAVLSIHQANPSYIWDGTTLVPPPAPPEPSLAEVKEWQSQLIKQAFDAEITTTGTLTITEGVIDSRRTDLDNLKNLAAYLYGMNATQTQLRLADNSMIVVTLTRLEEIIAELIGHGLALYQLKWVKLELIEAATTVAEVQAVVW